MIILAIVSVPFAIWTNIVYTEYLLIKKPKKDVDLMSGYRELWRIRGRNI